MERRNELKNYIELCISNEKAKAPYIELLGTELSIYETINKSQRIIGKLLKINDYLIETIEDFAYFGYINATFDDGITRHITDIDRFVDLLIEWEE